MSIGCYLLHLAVPPKPQPIAKARVRPQPDVETRPEPSSSMRMVSKILKRIAALRKDRPASEQPDTTIQFAKVAADDLLCDSLVQAGRCLWVPEEWVRERQAAGFVLYRDPESRLGMVRVVVPGPRGAVDYLMEWPPGSSRAATTPVAPLHPLRAQSVPPREGQHS